MFPYFATYDYFLYIFYILVTEVKIIFRDGDFAELFSDISSSWSKIRDKCFVGTDFILISWYPGRFILISHKLYPLRHHKRFMTNGHLAWPNDLTWTFRSGINIFRKCAEMIPDVCKKRRAAPLFLCDHFALKPPSKTGGGLNPHQGEG